MATTTRPPIRPNPERQAKEVAKRYVDSLSGILEGLGYATGFATEYPLLADVTAAIEDLSVVMRLASRSGDPVYCLREGGSSVPIVAVPLSAWGERELFRWYTLTPNYDYPELGRVYERVFRIRELVGGITVFKPSEIPEMIMAPLTNFLAVRFQWVADNPEFRSLGAAASTQANNPYLPFTVVAQTSGLRIHYSNSFAINFNNVFGAPTSKTPLQGWILPGIHKFAGMDSSGGFHYDPGTFPTPPKFQADLII
jgi:hypothetical protein